MRNQWKTAALLALLSALLITISYWSIGGTSGILVGVVIAAVTNLFSWYQSDKIALFPYRAQPVSPQEAPNRGCAIAKRCCRLFAPTSRCQEFISLSVKPPTLLPQGEIQNMLATIF